MALVVYHEDSPKRKFFAKKGDALVIPETLLFKPQPFFAQHKGA